MTPIKDNKFIEDFFQLIIQDGSSGIKEAAATIYNMAMKMERAEVHWRDFLKTLVKRGLTGVHLIISDAHHGLKAARKAIFPSVKWQRCQFHLSQNAQSYAVRKSMKAEIAQAMRDIFSCATLNDAMAKKGQVIEQFAKKAPAFTEWLDENIEEGFTIYSLPRALQKKTRTSNQSELLNKDLKRRTRVVGIFPNPESCLRLCTAILQEKHEDWITGRKYMNEEELKKILF